MVSEVEAELLLYRREVLAETAFIERVVWLLPQPLPGSSHRFKYRLALVVNGECVMRYDNEAGKGDHRHMVAKKGIASPGSTNSWPTADVQRIMK